MSLPFESANIALTQSNKDKNCTNEANSVPHNTTESGPKIDLSSQRIDTRVCHNDDDISEMSAPISEAEPETTATALRTKTISQRQSMIIS